jgi:hypothetical protein
MFKDKITSAVSYVKDHRFEFGLGAAVAAVAAIEIRYPGTFEVEKEVPTMKIIHVHVSE